MFKERIVKIVSISCILLGTCLFFVFNYQFDHDSTIMKMLEMKDVFSALNRLVIYFIPGVYLFSGFFAIVLDSPKILLVANAFMFAACILCFNFIGTNLLLKILSIVGCILTALYLLMIIVNLPKKVK